MKPSTEEAGRGEEEVALVGTSSLFGELDMELGK